MENNIMGLVGAFISNRDKISLEDTGLAIMLAIGVQILGNAVQDCSELPDFNATAPGAVQIDEGVTLDNQQTGWSAQCITNNDQSQSAYTLLIVILVVVAAVAILSVVRML